MMLPSLGVPSKILAGEVPAYMEVTLYYRARMKQAIMKRIHKSYKYRSNDLRDSVPRVSDTKPGYWDPNKRATVERKGHDKVGIESGTLYSVLEPGEVINNDYVPSDSRQKITLNAKYFKVDIDVDHAENFHFGINSWGLPQPERHILPENTKEAWWPWYHDSHVEVMPDVLAKFKAREQEIIKINQSRPKPKPNINVNDLTKSQKTKLKYLLDQYKDYDVTHLSLSFRIVHVIFRSKKNKKVIYQFFIGTRGQIQRK